MTDPTIEATYWRCTHCNTDGVVTYAVGASVYEVVNLLEQSHARSAPPSCDYSLTHVRVSRDPFPAAATQETR